MKWSAISADLAPIPRRSRALGLRGCAMTLDQDRKSDFMELAPLVAGFAALGNVGQAVTVVAELVRGLH